MKNITKVCPSCGEKTVVQIPETNYEEWQMGVCIQHALPEGTSEQRETLISGFCPECQKKVFGEEEDVH